MFKSKPKKISTNSTLFDELSSQQPANSIYSGNIDLSNIKDASIFTYTFKLPSLGKFYSGKDFIKISPLTIGQVSDMEQALNKEKLSEKFESICSILDLSILEINSRDLTIPDFFALCYELRIISYLEPIKLTTIVNSVSLDLPLTKDMLKVNYLENKLSEFKFDVDFPRVRDEIFSNSLKEFGTPLSKVESNLFGYVKGDSPEEKLDKLRSLKLENVDNLAKFTIKSDHGLQEKIEVTLPNGEKTEVDISFSFFYFFPTLIRKII